jgi:acyl transferase domain-containing protein
LDTTNHPLLSAAVDLGDRGHVFTGRLDTRTQPWLAEHAVLDTVLLPGTAFVEMALWAGNRFGCDLVDELTLQAPLVLPEGEAVQLQVSVGVPDDSGRRAITVASRPSGTPGDRPWTRHADGVLAPDTERTPTADPSAWPPATAVPIDLTGAYDTLADLGYQYGPTFQGLAAAWRDGADLYAEVRLAQDTRPNEFAIHPALLDAALHPLILGAGESPQLPFSWSRVRLHAVDATALRVRIATADARSATLTATDPTGAPVVSIDGLVTRPVPPDQLVARRAPASLYRVVWHEVPAGPVAGGRWAVLGANDLDLPDVEVCDDLAAVAAAAPDVVLASVRDTDPHAATHRALGLVQDWLADERFESARLVVLTRGAVAATPNDRIHDLAGSPLWGLVRTAQVEHPGRFVLLDVDEHGTSSDTIASVLAADDGQFAIRATRPYVPRLAPATPDGCLTPLNPDGTVLVTGGTGALGALVARQLITHHDARHIVLASRSGPAAAGAAELRDALTDLGADVTITACDAADRDALAELLAAIPPRHPLTAIVHAAGTIDDGPVTALTTRQVDAVFESKVDAAWHLHELTKDLDLAAFLLFSSTAGVLGNPGQANYAAANTYLDALAHYRHGHGLVATSLSWGLWANATGMTQHLSQADHARLRRTGIAALTTEQALSHLSTALTAAEPHLVPVRLDVATVTGQASSVAPLLRDLVRVPRRPAAHGAAANGDSWLERLRGLPSTERQNALATMVRTQAATVLGHATPDTVDTARTFTDLGFDSLTAVEFRNRLNSATGLRLPTTLTFEYPTPVELVAHLRAELFGEQERDAPTTAVLAELDRLDSAMSSVDPTAEDVTGIDTRLREILAKWSEIQNASHNGDRDLDSATADDLLEIIHKEFGRS